MDKIDAKQHLEELIDSFQDLIFSICCKLTGDYFAAEDLTQETFLSAYRHMDTFTGENEKAWLCRIASNKCIDYLKSAKRRQIPADEETFKAQADRSPGPEERLLEQEAKQTLLKCCRELKPPYDAVARLYFRERLSSVFVNFSIYKYNPYLKHTPPILYDLITAFSHQNKHIISKEQLFFDTFS